MRFAMLHIIYTVRITEFLKTVRKAFTNSFVLNPYLHGAIPGAISPLTLKIKQRAVFQTYTRMYTAQKKLPRPCRE